MDPASDQPSNVRSGLGPSWADRWGLFLGQQSSWWQRVSTRGEPVYALPTPIIDALAEEYIPPEGSEHRRRRPLISGGDVDAERGFTRLCAGFGQGTVGVWDGLPIRYLALCRRVSPALDDSTGLWEQESLRAFFERRPGMKRRYCREHEVTESALEAELDEQDRLADFLDRQSLGYVGRLSFNEQYRSERDRLRERCTQRDSRLPWPVPPACPPVLSVELERLPRQLIDADDLIEVDPLACEMVAFLRQWGLGFLETWDLPVPNGPLEGLPLRLVAQLRGPEITVDHYPSHYDLPADKDLREQIRSRQEREGQDKGIAMPFPVTDASGRSRPRSRSKGSSDDLHDDPLTSATPGADYAPSKQETCFRMYLLEQAVRARFDDPPHGLVVRLLEGFSRFFGTEPDTLTQYRKQYQKHL